MSKKSTFVYRSRPICVIFALFYTCSCSMFSKPENNELQALTHDAIKSSKEIVIDIQARPLPKEGK